MGFAIKLFVLLSGCGAALIAQGKPLTFYS